MNKLIVEITTRDDKTKRYNCVDFPVYDPSFITLFRPNFVRQRIRTETILKVKEYFGDGRKNKV